MPLNGDVKTFPLSAIVQMIHDEHKTGMLTVVNPRRRCSIYFKGGKIIFVRGNTDAELRLGALMRANNLISEDRLQDMLAVAKAMEKRLGTVLLERKHVTAEQLTSILNLQFKEVVTSTLSWEDAKFTYTEGLDGYVEDIKIEVDPVRLVAEAKKRGEFKGLIPNDQVVFEINPRVDTTKSVRFASSPAPGRQAERDPHHKRNGLLSPGSIPLPCQAPRPKRHYQKRCGQTPY